MEQPTNEPAIINQQLDKSTMYGGMIAVKGDNNTVHQYNYQNTLEPIKPPKFIPHQGTRDFVGRSQELVKIHEKLYEQQNTVAISALQGMGGIGKTELAVKYARQHQDNYPGGVCWFNVRSSNIATEILTFAKNYLKLEVPQKDYLDQPLTLKQQVEWCWQNWQPPEGLVLVVSLTVSTEILTIGFL
jgi:NB-ARC domain